MYFKCIAHVMLLYALSHWDCPCCMKSEVNCWNNICLKRRGKHSPSFSCSTLKGCSNSCLVHSTTPRRALASSSNALMNNGRWYWVSVEAKCITMQFGVKVYTISAGGRLSYLRVKGMASKRRSTSLKKVRDVFIFNPYCLLGSLL